MHTLYGYVLLRTSLDKKGDHFPLVSRDLKGWKARALQQVRDAIPFCVVAQVALFFKKKSGILAAILVLLQFDTYARPSEALALHEQHFSLQLPGQVVPSPNSGLSPFHHKTKKEPQRLD